MKPIAKLPTNTLFVAIFTAVVLTLCTRATAEDWPQWMGSERNGEYSESGLVDAIPETGLTVKWTTEVGAGYSGPAVVGDRVYISDYVRKTGELTNGPGTRDKTTGQERVLCLDAQTGDILWTHQYDRSYALSFAAGPRATPTVVGDHVWVLGAEGDLTCLDRHSGKPVWHKALSKEFPSPEGPIWGHAAHPLVQGDTLYCLGGTESVAVALNKNTGEVIWKSLTASEIGYCPPTLMTAPDGTQQLVIWHADSINGLAPSTGKLLWTEKLRPQYAMSIAAPVIKNNHMFASGIGKTAAMYQLDDSGKPTSTLWKGKTGIGVYSGNSTAVVTDEAIYGSDCETGLFIAVDPKTGDRLWETYELTTGGKRRASHGTAFVVKNGEQYFVFTETGDLLIAKFSREGFDIKGRMHVLDPTNNWGGRDVVWSHPAFARKCMFARNDKEIVCVSLATQE